MSPKVKKTLYWVIVSLLIAIILFSVVMIAYKLISDASNEKNYDDLSNMVHSGTSTRLPVTSTVPTGPTVPTTPVDPSTLPILDRFQPLYELNNDLVGWIQIPGTNVDYPVMQTKDRPNFYLRRNFEKKYADCGSVYVREACDVYTPSDNVLLYGHNMVNGAMFHDLINYKEQSFWENNRYIFFDTIKEEHCYEIFAVFVTTADPSIGFRYHLFTNAGTEYAFDRYVTTARDLSYYDTGITPQYGDKLLTLSTCDRTLGYGGDGRLVVMARRIS